MPVLVAPDGAAAHGPPRRRARDGARRRGRRDDHGACRRSPRRTPREVAAAAPGAPRWFQLYVTARPRRLARAHRRGGRRRLPGDRRHRRRARARTPRARLPHRLPRARWTSTMPAVSAASAAAAASPSRTSSRSIDPTRHLEATSSSSSEDCPLPVLVKGIQTAEDAALACEHGAAGIVVSNHGGRQLDTVAATAEMLPEIVDAVDGRARGPRRRRHPARDRRARRAALGARAVLVGRPALWGLAAGGEQGARDVLEPADGRGRARAGAARLRSPAEVTRTHVT